jgi:hypothetical protein
MITPLTSSFRTRGDLEQAVAALTHAGIPADHLSLVLPGSPPSAPSQDHDGEVPPVLQVTGVVNGAIGGAVGIQAGTLSLIFPGIGLLHAIGPISIILGSAAAGAALGGLTSIFMQAGMELLDAQRQEEAVRKGGLLLIVHPMNLDEFQLACQMLGAAGHLAEAASAPR